MNNLDGDHGIIHEVNGGLGVDVHLYPDEDFAILISDSKISRSLHASQLCRYQVWRRHRGCWLPVGGATVDAGGNITLGGIIHRVAKGVVNAVYKTDLNSGDGHPLTGIKVLEVNFLFVPGNSGGTNFRSGHRLGDCLRQRVSNP